nr:PREDICTED: origin recognition complex subunit 5 [Lepisosteus oculatus]
MPAQLQHPGYPAGRLQAAEEAVPCREAQAAALLALFGEPEHYSYPSLFLYGHRATGKSHVTLTLLRELQLPHAAVSCVECFSAGLLFEQVLGSLFGHEAVSQSLARYSSFSDFVRVFQQLSARSSLPRHTRYIVLDRAELLRDMDANLLPGFLRLQELVEDNVTVILLSEIVWEKFRPGTGCFEPLVLHFPDYSKAELQLILSQDPSPAYSPELYGTYINILLGVFFTVCRDLRELRHLAALNFPKFCEPLEKGEGLSAHAHVELPCHSKFLLIAAYLASYNPARTDRRFFLKHHGRIKKTNFLKKHEKGVGRLRPPPPDPLSDPPLPRADLGDEGGCERCGGADTRGLSQTSRGQIKALAQRCPPARLRRHGALVRCWRERPGRLSRRAPGPGADDSCDRRTEGSGSVSTAAVGNGSASRRHLHGRVLAQGTWQEDRQIGSVLNASVGSGDDLLQVGLARFAPEQGGFTCLTGARAAPGSPAALPLVGSPQAQIRSPTVGFDIVKYLYDFL